MSTAAEATLILTAATGSGAIDAVVIETVRRIAGQNLDAGRWLAPAEAFEARIAVSGDGLAASIRAAVSDRPIDVNVITGPSTLRRKTLLVADMDSTIIQQECIDEMADARGLKPRIAAITERAMRGDIAFEDALRERLGLLAGISEPELAEVFERRITVMPGAKTLVQTMKANGAAAALVSGGFTFYTSRVAKAVGFDTNDANTLEFSDGRLTGRVIGPILGREAKLEKLNAYRTAHRLESSATLAVGDGANDLAMIKAAGLGVAYRAKPVVAAEAHAAIRHADLTGLLYLQGYARDEFAVA